MLNRGINTSLLRRLPTPCTAVTRKPWALRHWLLKSYFWTKAADIAGVQDEAFSKRLEVPTAAMLCNARKWACYDMTKNGARVWLPVIIRIHDVAEVIVSTSMPSGIRCQIQQRQPGAPLRAFGTPGHLIEWDRLCLHIHCGWAGQPLQQQKMPRYLTPPCAIARAPVARTVIAMTGNFGQMVLNAALAIAET